MLRILIVGKPNVGKSSLFNRLVRQRKALVINQPGITRDILKQRASWWGVDFEVWDSGGLWSEEENWGNLIDKKVSSVISESDLVLFIMDARSGFLEEDKKTFQLVKKSGKPFLTLVNKVDSFEESELLLSDFYALGVNLLPCAFEKDRGVSEIVEWVLSYDKNLSEKKTKTPKACLLIAGKTNVGKSTLCNALLRQDRSLTSPVAGTTVDIVEDSFSYRGQVYTLLDTAGVEKSGKFHKKESLSELKSQQSFKRADLILILIDYSTGPSRQDARLLNFCAEEHKAVMIVVNKWDLARNTDENNSKVEYRKNIQDKFRFYSNLPIIFISAVENSGLGELMKKVEEMYKKIQFRISTPELNRFFMTVIRKAPSPVYGSRDVKFYYLTQTHQAPPSFIAFANYPAGVRDSYRRFLVRQIQNKWNLKGIPIRITVLPR